MKSNFANVENRFEEQVAKPPTGLISEKIVGESKSLERKKFPVCGSDSRLIAQQIQM